MTPLPPLLLTYQGAAGNGSVMETALLATAPPVPAMMMTKPPCTQRVPGMRVKYPEREVYVGAPDWVTAGVNDLVAAGDAPGT